MRLVIAAAAALFTAPAAAEPTIALAPGETLLEVRAEGEARTRPDMMTVTAGTVTTGETAQAAMRANAALAERMIAAIRAGGVEPRDVRTDQLRVSPRFARGERERAEVENRPPRITGYVASNRVEVRFRDLSRAPAVMDALFEAGANELNGPYFTLSDPAPAQRLAERDAVAKARAEAENYAAAFGKRIGRVLRVSERGASSRDDGTAIVVTGSRIQPPVEPGEITTTVTLYVDFALVDR